MNPHTRYEVYIAPVPRIVILALMALLVGAVLGSIYLTATTPEQIIPPMPRIHIPKPDIQGTIQKKVDARNPFLHAQEVR
jgi:hypothetical protein